MFKIGTIGQLRQFQAAMGLLSIVITGQLELLIPAAKTLKESHSLLASAKLSVCWLAGGLITLGLAISLNWFYLLLVIAASCEAWTRINKFFFCTSQEYFSCDDWSPYIWADQFNNPTFSCPGWWGQFSYLLVSILSLALCLLQPAVFVLMQMSL